MPVIDTALIDTAVIDAAPPTPGHAAGHGAWTAHSPALLTDRYELTMLESWLRDGSAHHQAIFECFARRLPAGRRYGVVAGLGRLLPLIEDFRFGSAELEHLLATGTISRTTADYLADFRFSGTIEAYREGELQFPGSPVLTVRSTLAEGCVLETLILSVLNHDSAVASAASRMVVAADGRPLIEMGSRRTHEEAAVASARVAYLAGFDSTSNMAAGFRYGIPTVGTAAHAFTLAHRSERDAFTSQVAALGPGTTLLVDTFDTAQGIRTAVDVAGPELGAIRIDSGDLDVEARKARTLLDELGATRTRIVVTSDLDEYVISALAAAPIDGYGVGTRLVTGSGHPTASMVYKLVAVADSPDPQAPLRPVAKNAPGKTSQGGGKCAIRLLGPDGRAVGERLVLDGQPTADDDACSRPLSVVVVPDGVTLPQPTLAESRAVHSAARAELAPEHLALADGPPALVARIAAATLTNERTQP